MNARQYQRFKSGLQRPRLTFHEKALILAARLEGARVKDLAEQFSVNRRTVWRVCRFAIGRVNAC